MQPDLFGSAGRLPEGFIYRPAFLTRDEESALLDIDVVPLTLETRSAYTMRDHARWAWQHSIVATRELRYSIALRTARRTRA